ncbi:hypothetical protein ABZ815_40670 [Nonomuraea sp. NPDC047529]
MRHPGLAALLAAVAELGRAHHWLRRPPDSWLPEADEALVTA